MLRVFISSASGALAPYRQAAVEVCHRLGHQPMFMEEFDPQRPPPEKVCRAKVESSDVLVLLLAHRYGSRPPGRNLSYTELEYRWAVERPGMILLPFVVDPVLPWPPPDIDHGEDAEALARLVAEVKDRHLVKRMAEIASFREDLMAALNIQIGDTIQAAAPVALAQLPPLVAEFTGRESELKNIAALLDPAGDAGAVVLAVAGLAGVGKSALAVHAAYAARQAGRFPGGVLFLDLHGYDDAPVEPGRALDALLRALGVPAENIPPGDAERAGLYRSKLAAIRDPVLIIADNASKEAQVEPLLPGPGPHRVVVTSRHTLARLGARLLDVKVLDDKAGVALLDKALRVGLPSDDRIVADRPGAARLAGICGGLPLALQITAALLKADPSRTVSDLADELTDEIRRLEVLQYDDGGGTSAPSVAAAFELSYRQLGDTTARVFRLLPVNPGPDLSTKAVEALANRPPSEVRNKAISQLVRAHLIEAAAGGEDRWRMHDLLRLYAQQLSDAHADADGREEARDRLLGYYLARAREADAHLRALPGTPVPAAFTGRDDALAWLDTERPNLIASVSMAARTGRDDTAMQLPLSLDAYLRWRRRFDDLLTIATISLDAARRLGDRHCEGRALDNLGAALWEVRRFEEAITACQDAAAIFQETGDRHNEGLALTNLGIALWKVRRFEEAITACQDAAAIFREIRDRHGEGLALTNLGAALAEVRRFEEATTACQDAAAIFRETADRHGEGHALDNLGAALAGGRRFEEATTACQDAAAIFRETADRHSEYWESLVYLTRPRWT